MAKGLSNISIREYRDFLTLAGCKKTREKGGHEHWTRADLRRPITIQSHIDPVPEFIVKNGLRILGLTREQVIKLLEK